MTREVKVKQKDVSEGVMSSLSGMYNRLMDECATLAASRYAGPKDYQDLMHDCFLTVSADKSARAMTATELHDYFLHRFNMILFQNVMDCRQERQQTYTYNADNKEITPEG